MDQKILMLRTRISQYMRNLKYLSPQNQIREKQQYLMQLEERLQRAMKQQIANKRGSLEWYIGRLKGLSPLDKLNQGFSYVSDLDGRTIRSISQVQEEEKLQIQVTDGTIMAKVTGTIAHDLTERRDES